MKIEHPMRTCALLILMLLGMLLPAHTSARPSQAPLLAPAGDAPPAQPELISSLAGNMRQVAISGSYAYIGEDIGDTSVLAVYNISGAPVQVGKVELAKNVTGLAHAGSMVYVATKGHSRPTRLVLIDVSTPRQPQVRGTLEIPSSGTVRQIAVVSTRLYLGGDPLYNPMIVNVSNPDAPVFVDFFGPGGSDLFTVDGNRAVIGSINAPSQLFDISDPDHPQVLRTFSTTGNLGRLVGSRLFMIRYETVSVIDITKPDDQALLGQYTLEASPTLAAPSGSYLFVTDRLQGLIALNVANPAAIVAVAAYHPPGALSGIAIAGSLIYLVGNFGMQVLEPASLAGPSVLASLELRSAGLTTARDVALEGRMAYVTAQLTDALGKPIWRLYMIDISNPSTPAVRGSYSGLRHANGLTVQNGIAYIANGASFEIVDVRNPAKPTRLSGLPIAAQGVVVSGSRAYVLGIGMTIVDISNPAKPRQLSHVIDNYDAGGVAVVGNLAYVSARNGLSIYDISNPAAPALRSLSLPAGFQPGPIQVANGIAYAAGEQLMSFDVHNPAHAELIDVYSTKSAILDIELTQTTAYIAANSAGMQLLELGAGSLSFTSALENGSYVERLAVAGNLAVLVGRNLIQIVDAQRGRAFLERGRIDRVPQALDVRLGAGVIYIAAGSAGLQIFDVRDPVNPRRLSVFLPQEGYEARFVELAGTLVYVGSSQRGLDVLDVSVPSRPRLRGTAQASISDALGRMQAVGQRLYVHNEGAPLEIYGLSDPLHPTLLGTYSAGQFGPYDFRIIGTLGYFTAGINALRIVNLANVASPTLIKEFTLAGDPRRIAVQGNYAYIGIDFNGQIEIVDITNPSAPSHAGTLTIGGFPWAMEANGPYLLLAEQSKLTVVGLGTPAAPVVQASLPVGGIPLAFQRERRLIYAAENRAGLQIFWYVPPTAALVGDTGGTLVSADDQTSYVIAAGALSAPTNLRHTPRFQRNLPPAGTLIGIDHAFTLSSVAASSQPAATQPYQISVSYTPAELGSAIEATLGLYTLSGDQWVRLDDSALDLASRTITASVAQTGTFAVLGATNRLFAPVAGR